MYCLGQFFFPNARNYIDVGWLDAFEDVNNVGKYDWGGAAFTNLYVSLGFAGRSQKSINGDFHILEFWGMNISTFVGQMCHRQMQQRTLGLDLHGGWQKRTLLLYLSLGQ